MLSPTNNEHLKFQIILCTVPNMETAKKIATTLIEEKIAACCNIVPGLLSLYFWDNKVQSDEELLLILKSEQKLYKKLEKRIIDLHPYDIPEIIVVPIIEGNLTYLNWINQNVKK